MFVVTREPKGEFSRQESFNFHVSSGVPSHLAPKSYVSGTIVSLYLTHPDPAPDLYQNSVKLFNTRSREMGVGIRWDGNKFRT